MIYLLSQNNQPVNPLHPVHKIFDHLFFVTVIAKSGQRISHNPHAVHASKFTTSGYGPFIAKTWVGQNSTQISQLLHHSFLILIVGSFFCFSVIFHLCFMDSYYLFFFTSSSFDFSSLLSNSQTFLFKTPLL